MHNVDIKQLLLHIHLNYFDDVSCTMYITCHISQTPCNEEQRLLYLQSMQYKHLLIYHILALLSTELNRMFKLTYR